MDTICLLSVSLKSDRGQKKALYVVLGEQSEFCVAMEIYCINLGWRRLQTAGTNNILNSLEWVLTKNKT